jgi:hypothetical protein
MSLLRSIPSSGPMVLATKQYIHSSIAFTKAIPTPLKGMMLLIGLASFISTAVLTSDFLTPDQFDELRAASIQQQYTAVKSNEVLYSLD